MTTLQQHNETVIAAKLPELAKETNPKQRQLHAELMLKHADLVKRNETLNKKLEHARNELNTASDMFVQAAYLFEIICQDLKKNGTAEADKALTMANLGWRESDAWAEIANSAAKDAEVQNV